MAARTSKSEQTRERIRKAAFTLFAQRGFESTTLRQIANEADCSLGLTYRYFKNKDALVFSLYEELSGQFETELASLPTGTVGQRWAYACRKKLEILAPHRNTLGTVLASALRPDSPVAVLGDATSGLRHRMHDAFTRLVRDASDAPAGADPAQLATLLYGLHLSVLLFWFNDRTEGTTATDELIDIAAGFLRMLPVLLPMASEQIGLERLSRVFSAVFLDPA